MLELRQVHAYYGRSHVLYGVDLAARAGEVVSLLGRNGAGKSTTLKSIVGLVDVTGGDILYEGRSLRGLRAHEISRLGIGFVPEDRRIFGDLTVVENLRVGERRGGAWTVEHVFGLFPGLRRLAGVKFARRLADRAYIIEKGQIKFEGSFGRLDVDASLRRAYLGV